MDFLAFRFFDCQSIFSLRHLSGNECSARLSTWNVSSSKWISNTRFFCLAPNGRKCREKIDWEVYSHLCEIKIVTFFFSLRSFFHAFYDLLGREISMKVDNSRISWIPTLTYVNQSIREFYFVKKKEGESLNVLCNWYS